ncbi:hypothetical protein Tco_1074013 [Tanacetum coccineum]
MCSTVDYNNFLEFANERRLMKSLTLEAKVIWDTLRDIGYEGSLTLLSFSKPLLSPQWKYLVHTLLHCLSSKSTSWDQFGTNIASALVGLATNQKFNFSKTDFFDGMLRNLKDSKPFLMYPRFIQLFLNKQLEGKVAYCCKAEHSVHTEELDITPSSHHSDDSSAGKKAESPSPVASERPASPNDYTPTDEVQTSGGDEGNLDLHGLTRELKATLSKKKKLKKAHKKKSSSFKQGRKKVSDGSTGLLKMKIVNSRPRRGAGITIPGNIPEQERPESPTQIIDPKDKGKGIMKEEPKKKKLTLQQLRAAETANDEEVAKNFQQNVQRTERENFTEEQKAKFLVETIAAQRRFRAVATRSIKEEANLHQSSAKKSR